jgi:hypothetical protein
MITQGFYKFFKIKFEARVWIDNDAEWGDQFNSFSDLPIHVPRKFLKLCKKCENREK